MSRPQQGFQLLTMDDILLQLNLPKFTFVKQLFFTAPNSIPVCIQPVNMVMFTITRTICGASDSGNMLFGRSFSNRALPERTSLLSECQGFLTCSSNGD
ncbi:hypothetical protein LINPERHAP1_LOCUS37467 [Linum perenne]